MNQKQKLNQKILKTLQSDFPLTKRPYLTMAERLGIKEAHLISKINIFKKNNTIRKIGAVASPKHLGYTSVLLAVKAVKAKIRGIVRFVNLHGNVTHNYLRDSEYNIWLTFSAKTKREINNFIRNLKAHEGVKDVLVLPSEKVFKINAEFKF